MTPLERIQEAEKNHIAARAEVVAAVQAAFPPGMKGHARLCWTQKRLTPVTVEGVETVYPLGAIIVRLDHPRNPRKSLRSVRWTDFVPQE